MSADRTCPDSGPAWRLFKEGRWDDAFEQLSALAADWPDDVTTLVRYGRVLAARRHPMAEAQLRRALELDPHNVLAMIGLSGLFAQEHRDEEAIAILERALEEEPENLSALFVLARLHQKKKRFSEAYAVMRRAVAAQPESPHVHTRFAQLLSIEAQRFAQRALDLDPKAENALLGKVAALKARGELAAAEALVQGRLTKRPDSIALQNEAALLGAARSNPGRATRPALFPRRSDDMADYEEALRRYVIPGSAPPAPFITPSSRLVTLGSCFAEHLAEELRRQGLDVFFQKRSENLDNLCATRALVDWVISGTGAEAHPFFSTGGPRQLQFEQFARADVIVLSLGVAAAYFSRDTGELVMPGLGNDKIRLAAASDHRMLSVEENVGHLRHIVQQLRQLNPGVQIVLTVSPVPLSATFERRSAVQADAVSKSTLRLTAATLMAEQMPGLYYWPSFEMVRWLGSYAPRELPPIFGAEDGANRHVSRWVVRMVIKLFLEHFAKGMHLAHDPADPEAGAMETAVPDASSRGSSYAAGPTR